jgi:hypothetical protein
MPGRATARPGTLTARRRRRQPGWRSGCARGTAGDEAAADTLRRAIAAAKRAGDLRIAATARNHLARLERAAGRPDSSLSLLAESDRWYASAGGGDGALLTRCLRAAIESNVDVLLSTLDDARAAGDAEVQVLALDALARVVAESGDQPAAAERLREADELFAGARHLLDQADRPDAQATRASLPVNPA